MASDGSIVRRFVQYNKEGAVDDINIVSHNNRFTNLFMGLCKQKKIDLIFLLSKF